MKSPQPLCMMMSYDTGTCCLAASQHSSNAADLAAPGTLTALCPHVASGGHSRTLCILLSRSWSEGSTAPDCDLIVRRARNLARGPQLVKRLLLDGQCQAQATGGPPRARAAAAAVEQPQLAFQLMHCSNAVHWLGLLLV